MYYFVMHSYTISGVVVPIKDRKGREGHRHSHTSPSTTTGGSTTTSRAHVIGIDMPSPSSVTPHLLGMSEPHIGRVPRRTHSFQEVSSDHPSERQLKQASKRTVSSPEKHEKEKRSKPRRSHSFNEQSPGGHGSDLNQSNTVRSATDYSTAMGHVHSYPLRETVSLNELPGGGGGYAGARYGPISHGVSLGQGYPQGSQGGGSGLVYTSLKSSSMRSFPSGESSGYHGHKQRYRSSRSHQKEVEKV